MKPSTLKGGTLHVRNNNILLLVLFFFPEDNGMITFNERLEIVKIRLRQIEDMAIRNGNETLRQVLGFMNENGVVIWPTKDKKFACPTTTLGQRPISNNAFYFFIYSETDLPFLSEECIKHLGLLDNKQVALYESALKILVLKATSILSPLFEALIASHEGFHCWRHLANNQVAPEDHWQHEVEAHLFSQLCARTLKIEVYDLLLRRHQEKIREQARRSQTIPGDVYFTGWPYDPELNEIFGHALSPTEEQQRMRFLNMHAMFEIIKEDSQDPLPRQTSLLKFVYQQI